MPDILNMIPTPVQPAQNPKAPAALGESGTGSEMPRQDETFEHLVEDDAEEQTYPADIAAIDAIPHVEAALIEDEAFADFIAMAQEGLVSPVTEQGDAETDLADRHLQDAAGHVIDLSSAAAGHDTGGDIVAPDEEAQLMTPSAKVSFNGAPMPAAMKTEAHLVAGLHVVPQNQTSEGIPGKTDVVSDPAFDLVSEEVKPTARALGHSAAAAPTEDEATQARTSSRTPQISPSKGRDAPAAVAEPAPAAARNEGGMAIQSETSALQVAAIKKPAGDIEPARAASPERSELSFAEMTEQIRGKEAQARQVETPARPNAAQQSFRSPLVANVAAQLQAHNLDQDKVTIRLRPHGMGIIEVEIAKGIRGDKDVVLRVQNPMVLEALRNERDAVADIWSAQGGLEMEMYSPDEKRQSQKQEANAARLGLADQEEPEEPQEIQKTGSGILI